MTGNPLIRLADCVFSALGLVLGAPVMLVLLVLCALETGSPIYRQQRLGRDQVPFWLYKFRTMAPGTAAVATHLADGSAVTRVGRVLRASKLDELPQLLNVLRGEMSLVGPRPGLPSQQELAEARARLDVFSARPGVTGLAQLQGVDMSNPERLAAIDARMLKSLSLRSYLRYIALTALGRGCGDPLSPPQEERPS